MTAPSASVVLTNFNDACFVGWSGEVRDFVFRQCWIDHAADEVTRSATTSSFVDAVRRLATTTAPRR